MSYNESKTPDFYSWNLKMAVKDMRIGVPERVLTRKD